jgi:mannose-6-phosphate isomerase-like protein (cupin superfamily)
MTLDPQQILQRLTDRNQLFLEVFTHGALSVEIYKPNKKDLQTPHDRDEIYVIISGTGTFINGGERTAFKPGTFLFVPEDFSTWVFYYGPKGGENPSLLK